MDTAVCCTWIRLCNWWYFLNNIFLFMYLGWKQGKILGMGVSWTRLFVVRKYVYVTDDIYIFRIKSKAIFLYNTRKYLYNITLLVIDLKAVLSRTASRISGSFFVYMFIRRFKSAYNKSIWIKNILNLNLIMTQKAY